MEESDAALTPALLTFFLRSSLRRNTNIFKPSKEVKKLEDHGWNSAER
jgi:hypothetical protein